MNLDEDINAGSVISIIVPGWMYGMITRVIMMVSFIGLVSIISTGIKQKT